jgi:creatinase
MNMFARGMPNQLLRLQEMHNGEKVRPTFSAGEMERRQNAMRRILEELKLDAAILTSYHNCRRKAAPAGARQGRRA